MEQKLRRDRNIGNNHAKYMTAPMMISLKGEPLKKIQKNCLDIRVTKEELRIQVIEVTETLKYEARNKKTD